MREFAVVLFPDERRAREGRAALALLHEEGSVTLYASALVERDGDGALSVLEETEPGALGLDVGALVGALAGQFADPVVAAGGVTAGGSPGGFREHFHAEVSDEFLASVERQLAPGKHALVAEISEEWVTPLDLRMGALGGEVVRAWRRDPVDELIERRAGGREAKLEERGAMKRLDETRAELEAKLAALQEQARKARPEVRGRIEQRIARLRADLGEREKELLRACGLAQEAIAARSPA